MERSTSKFSVYDLRENISDYDACYQIDICPLQEWNNQHIKAIEILVSHY